MSLLPARFHDATAAAHAGLGAPVNRSLTPSDQRRADAAERRRDALSTFEDFTHEIDDRTGEPLPEVRVHPGEPLTREYVTELIRKADKQTDFDALFREAVVTGTGVAKVAGGVHDSLDKMLERAASQMHSDNATGMRRMQDAAAVKAALDQLRASFAPKPAIHDLTKQAIDAAQAYFAEGPLSEEVRAYYKRLAPGKVNAVNAVEAEYFERMRY